MSSGEWARPMASSTAADMDWGFTETRPQPWARRTESFSAVMVSGRPASTVYSVQPERSTCSSRAVMTWWSCRADRVVGVPPPK